MVCGVVSGARNSASIGGFRHVIGIAGTAHAGCAKIDTRFPARCQISCAVQERICGTWRIWTHQEGGIENLKMGLLNVLGENE
jgi:hypothetical protein